MTGGGWLASDGRGRYLLKKFKMLFFGSASRMRRSFEFQQKIQAQIRQIRQIRAKYWNCSANIGNIWQGLAKHLAVLQTKHWDRRAVHILYEETIQRPRTNGTKRNKTQLAWKLDKRRPAIIGVFNLHSLGFFYAAPFR